nr:LOW QUALITY PROTEIN: adoMet-dependent rRNA methyltransferase SPB1-like [Aegilops tauschii subsp. strangulata]
MGKAKGKQLQDEYYHLAKDITTTRCRSATRRLIDTFDVVLHDGSPNVGSAWAQEATAQSALVIDAVRLATMFLAPNGTFVTITKVFRSQDYSAIMFCLKQLFHKVEVTKPRASRGTSAEIYIICLNIKNHDLTTDEVKYLCEDLQVLDKNSFKHILEWRTRVRKALPSSSQVTPQDDGAATDTKVKDDVQLLQEMEEMDSDEEHQLEEMLDEAYERYVTKMGEEVKQEHKRAKRIDPDANAGLLERGEDDGGNVGIDQGSDKDQGQETNPLLLCLDTEKPAEEQDVKAVVQSGYVHRRRKKGKGGKGGAKGGKGMKGSAGQKK